MQYRVVVAAAVEKVGWRWRGILAAVEGVVVVVEVAGVGGCGGGAS